MTNPPIKEVPSSARTAKLLGQLSIVGVILSIIIGAMVETIGINSLLFSFSIPLSLVAIFLSNRVRRSLSGPEDPGYKEAASGQRMGMLALGVVLVFIIAVAVFFTLAFWGR